MNTTLTIKDGSRTVTLLKNRISGVEVDYIHNCVWVHIDGTTIEFKWLDPLDTSSLRETLVNADNPALTSCSTTYEINR